VTVGSLSIVKNDSNIDRHVIPEVLVSSNEYVAIGILEVEPGGIALVEPVEIFDSGNDGLGGVVWEDLHLQWKSGPIICSAIEEQLERDCLGYRTSCRRLAPSRGRMQTSTLLYRKIWMVLCVVVVRYGVPSGVLVYMLLVR